MAFGQSDASFLSQNWIETRTLFLGLLLDIVLTSIGYFGVFFSRDWYQKDTGDLPHIHIMLRIKCEYLSEYQIKIINDLLCESIMDIVHVKELKPLIEKNVLIIIMWMICIKLIWKYLATFVTLDA